MDILFFMGISFQDAFLRNQHIFQYVHSKKISQTVENYVANTEMHLEMCPDMKSSFESITSFRVNKNI